MAKIEDTHPHTISDVTAMFGVTPRTLRFYEERHLISPKRISGGRRVYSDADVARVQKITHLTHLGFSLLEVKQLLGAKSEDQLIQALRQRRGEVSAEIEHLQQILSDISDAIAATSLSSQDEAA